MFENYNIPAGFTQVSDLSALANSANRSAIFFHKDDEIACSDIVVSKVRTDKQNQPIKDDKGSPLLVFSLICSINNGKPRPVPFASFRRFPRDADEFLSKSDLARNLYTGSDEDRYNLLKGKTLKIKDLIEGEAIDWDKSNADTREFVYKKAKFPLFELK